MKYWLIVPGLLGAIGCGDASQPDPGIEGAGGEGGAGGVGKVARDECGTDGDCAPDHACVPSLGGPLVCLLEPELSCDEAYQQGYYQGFSDGLDEAIPDVWCTGDEDCAPGEVCWRGGQCAPPPLCPEWDPDRDGQLVCGEDCVACHDACQPYFPVVRNYTICVHNCWCATGVL